MTRAPRTHRPDLEGSPAVIDFLCPSSSHCAGFAAPRSACSTNRFCGCTVPRTRSSTNTLTRRLSLQQLLRLTFGECCDIAWHHPRSPHAICKTARYGGCVHGGFTHEHCSWVYGAQDRQLWVHLNNAPRKGQVHCSPCTRSSQPSTFTVSRWRYDTQAASTLEAGNHSHKVLRI